LSPESPPLAIRPKTGSHITHPRFATGLLTCPRPFADAPRLVTLSQHPFSPPQHMSSFIRDAISPALCLLVKVQLSLYYDISSLPPSLSFVISFSDVISIRCSIFGYLPSPSQSYWQRLSSLVYPESETSISGSRWLEFFLPLNFLALRLSPHPVTTGSSECSFFALPPAFLFVLRISTLFF